MTVEDVRFVVETKSELDIKNITEKVKKIVQKNDIQEGTVTLFVAGSTAAITTIEYESGLIHDISEALDRLFPKDIHYKHHEKWHDGNGHSHIRASFIGQSFTAPITDGELELGTWQQIILCDMDVKSRSREVIVKMIGE
ncbi:MAG: secondary thiamine-phosphate synthase enzyme YjbQ [Candidatus Thermoplasmatota archaeon]|nr:secondary thiamine-phosphate synthase enzyme YjbQ [Candidatus Thermoplasmatota archaeon]MBS3790779.1 secondary thiamine-phosphate synthase enzyme YjbQ [Candidatus Thermoplasmatota archaeon]